MIDLNYIIIIAAGLICLLALIPFVIKYIKAIKALATAKTAEEIAIAEKNVIQAQNDILQKTIELVETTELSYKGIEQTLEANGQKAGSFKKEAVMSKLQNFAFSKGYTFDEDQLSSLIDSVVCFMNTNK